MKKKALKLRFLFLIFLTGLILSGCKKDETLTDNLTGTWTAGTSTFSIMVGSKTLAQYITDEMGLTAAEAQQFILLFNQELQQSFSGTIQIKSDGTYTSSMGGTADTGTWSLSSDGKKLTIDSSTDDPMIFDVIELTSDTLHINISESDSEDLDGDDIPETMTISVDITFTK